jgi:hypothetical protein
MLTGFFSEEDRGGGGGLEKFTGDFQKMSENFQIF